jgi:hypothetical protein
VNHGTRIGKTTNNNPKAYGNREPRQRCEKAHPSQRPVGWPPYAQKVKRGDKKRS